MACILHIETSGKACSVALSESGELLYHKEDMNGPHHASLLAPLCDEALSFADSHGIPLDAVSVSAGPGSYTGLRIGVSTAKGICYAREVPLLGIDTLRVLCVPSLLAEEIEEEALLCPMIDARRMEVYATILDRGLRTIRAVQADIVDADTYTEWLEKHVVYFIGRKMQKHYSTPTCTLYYRPRAISQRHDASC